MRVTLKKITVTTIISFILYVFIMLSLFSCKTAKKTWVEENFTSKDVFNTVQETTENFINTEVSTLRKDFTVKYSEFLQKEATKNNEATTVKGTITAEDGKEKSVNVGTTKIVSNGANISFEIASTKEQLKETETKQTEILEQLSQVEIKLQQTQNELNSLKSEFANYTSNQKTTTKETNKRGFTFGVILIGIVLLVVFLVYRYFNRKYIL